MNGLMFLAADPSPDHVLLGRMKMESLPYSFCGFDCEPKRMKLEA